jgi:hypothetical protein
MVVREASDVSVLAAISAAPCALVFLSVPWSAPERNARAAFFQASERLAQLGLGVECFLLDEEAEWCQRWQSSLSVPQLGSGTALGAGSVLWLERGHVAASEISGQQLRAVGMIARSKELWG